MTRLAVIGRAAAIVAGLSSTAAAQQVVDTSYSPRLRSARSFAEGRGPAVMIDQAHENFHTASGRYRPFVRLLEADGFVVGGSAARFDSVSLERARVLVVANAVAARNKASADWRLPIYSAFAPDEVAAVTAWVRRGGSLLLIADHMPFAGAADSLAAVLGVFFANGFALPPHRPDAQTGDYPIVFRRNAELVRHPILDGRSAGERVDSVASFTGSAFRLVRHLEGAGELLRLPRGTRVRLPVVAWQFSDSTPEMRGDEMLQGAVFRFGDGRVAVFGEAAMFSAQVKGPGRAPMGMNAPMAADNAQFVLNVLHWLVGLLPDR